MFLELADNADQFLIDNTEFDKLPVLDPNTGEIYYMNSDALALLTEEELNEIETAAPFLLQKIYEQSGTMDKGLFSRIRERVQNTTSKAREKIAKVRAKMPLSPQRQALERAKAITGGPLSIVDHELSKFEGKKTPMEIRSMPAEPIMIQPEMYDPYDPRFSLSINPSPSSWWQKPGVLIGGAAVLLGGIFLITRKR